MKNDFVYLSSEREHISLFVYLYHRLPRFKCKKFKPLLLTYLLQRPVCGLSLGSSLPSSIHCPEVCKLTFSDPVAHLLFSWVRKCAFVSLR